MAPPRNLVGDRIVVDQQGTSRVFLDSLWPNQFGSEHYRVAAVELRAACEVDLPLHPRLQLRSRDVNGLFPTNGPELAVLIFHFPIVAF